MKMLCNYSNTIGTYCLEVRINNMKLDSHSYNIFLLQCQTIEKVKVMIILSEVDTENVALNKDN